MKVKLMTITPNALENIFKGYRVCYSKLVPDQIELRPEKDMIDFVKRLIRLGHLTPLEHVSFTFSVEDVSRVTMAQLTKHRTAKINTQSQRYVDAQAFDFVIPDSIEDNDKAFDKYNEFMVSVQKLYREFIDMGIKKEDARFILPNATTTNMIVTMDLRNFMHFYSLRNCTSAQWEIRKVAQEMMKLVKEHIPFADHNVMKCGKTCFDCKRAFH